MDSAKYNKKNAWLESIAEETLCNLKNAFSTERLAQIMGAMTWTELLGNCELQFEFQVFKESGDQFVVIMAVILSREGSQEYGANGQSASVVEEFELQH